MKLIKVSLQETYGRKRYKPKCETSRLILSFMKMRSAFTEEEIKRFIDSDWEVVVDFED